MVELDNPILIALSRFTIQDIIARESSLATVTADATIEELLAVLTERAFLSLPITDQGCVLGVVDCLDLMSFYSHIFAKVKVLLTPPISQKYLAHVDADDSDRLGDRQTVQLFRGRPLSPVLDSDCMLRPVRDLVNFSGRNPTVFVKESMVLSDFVKTLTTGSNHRALILDEFEDSEINASPSMEHIKDIISQHDIAVFLHKLMHWAIDPNSAESEPYRDIFAPLAESDTLRNDLVRVANSRVRDLGLGTSHFEKSIISVEDGVPVLDALKFVIAANVSVLAVVDKAGKLLNSLSGSDLRHLTSATANSLTRPISEFLAAAADVKPPLATITRKCTLLHALNSFASPHRIRPIHHLWLTDKEGRAVGLMSLTDLMRISTTYHLPHDHSVHKERVIGQLSVSILLARNLKPSKNLNRKLRSTYVVVKYPSQSPVKTPVVPNTLSPSFRNATFSFTVNSTQLGKFLTISLYDRRSFFLSPDKLLGSIEIDISWIANGFGRGRTTGSTMEIKKWIKLQVDGKVEPAGELLVRLSYSPIARA
ncbi:unnamed protein product (mitochondrion) [Plasmodiophora brassicae]|uniref:C2 domain-containing protein n=1 Tax=Plasmodiophora brassicae TaxID=37360 RepID=A0A0G4J5B6_PLABS|nr:hypothetical protein PBRA_002760 [Plasmodiophora brassicae]SPQ94910.1 unnamed protein product [Plasmodiophora brassicae]